MQYEPYVVQARQIRKGATFSELIPTDGDLRGSALIGEIRRLVPGKAKLSGFVASARQDSPDIRITKYPPSSGFTNILDAVGITEGDGITITGAGIQNATVLAVSHNGITIDQLATRTISDTKFSFRASAIASFLFRPATQLYSIAVSETTQPATASLSVSGYSLTVGDAKNLVFREYNRIPVTGLPISVADKEQLVFKKNDLPVTVRLSAAASSRSLSLPITGIDQSLPQGATSILGASTVILREPITANQTTASVYPLEVPVPKDSYLNFAYRDELGWRVVGTVVASDSALENSLSIPIFPFIENREIPRNSIAYSGTIPFKNFHAFLSGAETAEIDTGDYAADIIAVRPDGTIATVAQFNKLTFTDNWSDIR